MTHFSPAYFAHYEQLKVVAKNTAKKQLCALWYLLRRENAWLSRLLVTVMQTTDAKSEHSLWQKVAAKKPSEIDCYNYHTTDMAYA